MSDINSSEIRYQYPEDHINDVISFVSGVIQAYKNASSLDLMEYSQDEVKENYEEGMRFLQKADDASLEPLAFTKICDLFELDELEKFCFMLSLTTAGGRTEFYETFAGMNNDNRKFLPTYELAIKLFDFAKGNETHNLFNRKMQLENSMKHLIFDDQGDGNIVLGDIIFSFLLTGGKNFNDIEGVEVYDPNPTSEPLLIMDNIAQDIYKVFEKTVDITPAYFYISGPKSCGKETQIKRFADLSNLPAIIIDIHSIQKSDEKTLKLLFENISRMAFIKNAILCIKNLDELQNGNADNIRFLESIVETSGTYVDYIFLLSQNKEYSLDLKEGRLWIDIPIELPTIDESVTMWETVLEKLPLEKTIVPSDFANKFSYTPGQILETFYEAERVILRGDKNFISEKELYKCAHKQTSHKLSGKADIVYSKNTWDNLVLPDREKTMLKNACNQVRFKHIVYDRWGMNDRISYGRGISMLFAGPPGTGKTMGANVIANELDIEMYKVNFSQIVSKYIGETEKNLNELFEEAKKTSVILFFDETDAILGKRTDVKDSHDKNANLETSYLLQKMEEYEGITIMTTNYLENIDTAFFRRISYVVHFPFPDIPSRKKIWQGMFPDKMPVDPDMDFDYLAKQFEISGGNIKNTVVSAAFLAAQEDTAVDMSHILKALKYELSKQGKIMLKEEFGEYEYLIEI